MMAETNTTALEIMAPPTSSPEAAMPLASALRDAIAAAQAVSFGFHGTLFQRATTPEAVFNTLARRFAQPGFAAQRKAAQAEAFDRARKAGRREVTLAGIYDCMVLDSALAQAMQAAEIALELDLLCPDIVAFDAFRHALAQGRRVLIIADSHLGRAFVREALGRHGLESVALFISGDCNLTAGRDGDLFDLAIDYLEVPRDRILHIGGDIAQARSRGLATIYYQGHDQGDGRSVGSAISASATLPAGTLSAHDLGYHVAGPAAVGFLNWMEGQAKLNDVQHVLFHSHDGHLLDRIVRENPGAWTLPPCSLLPGSGTAFALATIDDQNFPQHLPFLTAGSDGLAPFEVLERIGVPAPAPEVMERYDLGDEVELSPATQARLRGFLFEYRFEILKICRRNRRALFDQMRRLGLEQDAPVALVDLGWEGATQEALEVALRGIVNLDIHGYSFCLADTEESRRRQRARQMAALFSVNSVAPSILRRLHMNRTSVGLLFSAPHNPIIGMESMTGGVRGIEDMRWAGDGARPLAVSAIVEGAVAFAHEHVVGRGGNSRPALPPLEMAWSLVELLDRPAPLSDAFRTLANFDPWTASLNRRA
ncbi:hypothetical protein [Nitrospirillum sp. BR 11163]|uniref:hypothetical protein n=1 Tax=Nitrospirillum sp. BR 11163 TaxID=3104323 RepID=UPI002AFF02FA|nr:hypothetical protein [Nitrospirillum sp. BR 11163]MEA1672393.1 hypothetical protein [Nitrospirillum sp. BR 11163]